MGRDEACEFWDGVLGPSGWRRIGRPAFARGFIDGALGVWEAVKYGRGWEAVKDRLGDDGTDPVAHTPLVDD
jgi:hypothetical protein